MKTDAEKLDDWTQYMTGEPVDDECDDLEPGDMRWLLVFGALCVVLWSVIGWVVLG